MWSPRRRRPLTRGPGHDLPDGPARAAAPVPTTVGADVHHYLGDLTSGAPDGEGGPPMSGPQHPHRPEQRVGSPVPGATPLRAGDELSPGCPHRTVRPRRPHRGILRPRPKCARIDPRRLSPVDEPTSERSTHGLEPCAYVRVAPRALRSGLLPTSQAETGSLSIHSRPRCRAPRHGPHPVGPGRMPYRSRGWRSLRCAVPGRVGASGRAEGRRTPYGQRPGVTCPRRSALGRAHALAPARRTREDRLRQLSSTHSASLGSSGRGSRHGRGAAC